jgi:integrase
MQPPKPSKPFPDFPLFPHSNGQWAKKIKGRLTYFGPWSDAMAALRKYHTMEEGPPASLKACIGKYTERCDRLVTSGELSYRHVQDIKRTLASLSVNVGPTRGIARLTSEDYGQWRAHLALTNGPVALGSYLVRARAFLNWCVREKILPAFPPGDSLKKPSRSVLRKERVRRGKKLFRPDECRQLIVCADPMMRAMILLALNAALGPNDLALLETQHIQGGWLDYPRPKTSVERRVPLWPETREALAAVILPNDTAVFRTKQGHLWLPKDVSGTGSPLSQKFTKLCQGAGVYQPGRGFYSLRHTVQTISEESENPDLVAIDYILGHAPRGDDMRTVYRERMKNKRLFRVVKYVRKWLGLSEFWKTHPFLNGKTDGKGTADSEGNGHAKARVKRNGKIHTSNGEAAGKANAQGNGHA